MIRERLDVWCERAILGLVLAALVFGPLALGGVRASEFLVLQALIMLALPLWLLRLWINPRLHLLWPPLCFGVLAFALYAIGRSSYVEIEYVGRAELIRVLLYACCFFVGCNNLYRHSSIRILVLTLVALGLAEGLFAIYQFITQAPHIWHFTRPEGYLPRGSGTYICPNHLAGLLGMLLPIALAWTVLARSTPLAKVMVGYACLMMAAGIAVSGSRGGWISVGLALLFLLLLLLGSARQCLGVGVMVLILGVIGAWIYSQSVVLQKRGLELKTSTAETRVNARYVTARAAFQMWQDHPWLGVGPAHFDYRFRQYHPLTFSMGRPGLVHNDYLNLLADWGLVGGLIVAGSLGALIWSLGRHWRRLWPPAHDPATRSREGAWFVPGAAAGLLALALHSLVDFNLHIPANAILAVTLVALLSSQVRLATDRCWVKVRWPLRLVITLAVLGLLGWFGFQLQRGAREQFWLSQARGQPALSTNRLASLERAFAADSSNAETAFAIGEEWRVQSWQGGENYRELAGRAKDWFECAARLNPLDPAALLRCGACLDWLDRPTEAEPWFRRALALDPNGYLTLAHMGRHCLQKEDYAAAIDWFRKSLYMMTPGNILAQTYLPIAEQKLAEQKASVPPK
jgi:O-antigen ligase